MSLKEQLAEYRAGWYQRVPAERQAIMQRHIEQLSGTIAKTMLKVGDRAPAIVLENAKGTIVDVDRLLKKGPVIVIFYRGGWCPYCNLELKAYQAIFRYHSRRRLTRCDQPGKARRHGIDRGEECAHIRGLERRRPKDGTGLRPGLRIHRRAQTRLPGIQSGYSCPQRDAGRMGAAGCGDIRHRSRRLDHLCVHGRRLPRPRRSRDVLTVLTRKAVAA